MDLDKIAVALRPRTAWEAIDLGFAMARCWFFPLWWLWWITALPVYLLMVALFPERPWLVLILIWWFKPLYEPALVFWMSRALFANKLGVGEIAQQWRSVTGSQLVANLTWRRFSGRRSFHMPVALLEGLRGRRRRERIDVLGRGQEVGVWLTVVGIHFEIAIEVSALMLLVLMLPQELLWLDLEGLFLSQGPLEEWLNQIVSLVAMSIIAPFYVAGGFALYLTRRTELEGWDLELSFRRIKKQRKGARPAASGLAASLTLVLGLVCILADNPAQAIELDREQARQMVERVLDHEDFGKPERLTYWRYIGGDDEKNDTRGHWLWELLVDMLAGFHQGFAAVGEFLLWISGGLLAVFLTYWILRNRGWLEFHGRERKHKANVPGVLFGLDIRRASLPRDIAGEALRLLGEGQRRTALSLLYRGTLAKFVHDHQLEIPDSATEGECLRLVSAARPSQESGFFQRLTLVWQRLAYGHLMPTVQQVEGLCYEWQQLYTLTNEK